MDSQAYELTLVTPPAVEPVTAAEAKLHAKADLDDEDSLFAIWVPAARKMLEDSCSIRLVTQTLKLVLSDWPCDAITLPVEPVSSVSSVKYRDADDVLTTLTAGTDYLTWLKRRPPIVYLGPYASWPSLRMGRRDAIEVEFVAGYGGADDVPEYAKAAILMAVAYWYENRGDEEDPSKLGLPQGVYRLMRLLDAGGYR